MQLLAREATPVRLVHEARRLELVAITQDVGQAHEELDAKYEGDELTVAFNPEYLIAGIEVTTGRRDHPRDHRRAEAGAASAAPRPRTSCTC